MLVYLNPSVHKPTIQQTKIKNNLVITHDSIIDIP